MNAQLGNPSPEKVIVLGVALAAIPLAMYLEPRVTRARWAYPIFLGVAWAMLKYLNKSGALTWFVFS